MAGMFLQEWLLPGRQTRGAPPSASLPVQTRIEAMQQDGRIDGRTAAGYLYQSGGISRTIRGARTCVDLGCGTGVQLLQVAALNPAIHFTGVDNCQALLDVAARTADARGLSNVTWVHDDITRPARLERGSFDAVIGTMCLHDLQDVESLHRCLRSAAGLLSPGGAIYLEDFARLKHPRSIELFVHRGHVQGPFAATGAPSDPFSSLYRASLRAAFSLRELRDATSLLPGARLHATFPVPFLCVISTPDRGLEPAIRQGLSMLRTALTASQARDLADLARAFALGGFTKNVFA